MRHQRRLDLLKLILEKEDDIKNLGYEGFQSYIHSLQENGTDLGYTDFQKRLMGYTSEELAHDMAVLDSIDISISDKIGPVITKSGRNYLKLTE